MRLWSPQGGLHVRRDKAGHARLPAHATCTGRIAQRVLVTSDPGASHYSSLHAHTCTHMLTISKPHCSAQEPPRESGVAQQKAAGVVALLPCGFLGRGLNVLSWCGGKEGERAPQGRRVRQLGSLGMCEVAMSQGRRRDVAGVLQRCVGMCGNVRGSREESRRPVPGRTAHHSRNAPWAAAIA